MRLSLIATLAAAGLTFATSASAETAETAVPMTAAQLLEPYYAALRERVTLPEAGTNAALAGDAVLSRIAFGSCNHQSRSQDMWAPIAASDPQLFLMVGDNVYGDTAWDGDANLLSLRKAYAEQAAHPEFARFRAAVPMMTTWDDHDFGLNDSGGVFPLKGWAEDIYEHFWNVSDTVRARPGIYESRTFGPAGQRVQIIMLDTRFFRSALKRQPYSVERRPLGNTMPNTARGVTMLGYAQWAWLEQELAKPADVRLVVSSIQALTVAHDFESWKTMPTERGRLLMMLMKRADSGLVLLSGDRHAGGIYTMETERETLWEITSSSLNLAFTDTATSTAREPDPARVTKLIAEENFGMVEIDWPTRRLTLSIRGAAGETRAEQVVPF